MTAREVLDFELGQPVRYTDRLVRVSVSNSYHAKGLLLDLAKANHPDPDQP